MMNARPFNAAFAAPFLTLDLLPAVPLFSFAASVCGDRAAGRMNSRLGARRFSYLLVFFTLFLTLGLVASCTVSSMVTDP
jgi:hypothetical protein